MEHLLTQQNLCETYIDNTLQQTETTFCIIYDLKQ